MYTSKFASPNTAAYEKKQKLDAFDDDRGTYLSMGSLVGLGVFIISSFNIFLGCDEEFLQRGTSGNSQRKNSGARGSTRLCYKTTRIHVPAGRMLQEE